MTHSSATLSWVWVVFRPLFPVILEISYAGCVVWHFSEYESPHRILREFADSGGVKNSGGSKANQASQSKERGTKNLA